MCSLRRLLQCVARTVGSGVTSAEEQGRLKRKHLTVLQLQQHRRWLGPWPVHTEPLQCWPCMVMVVQWSDSRLLWRWRRLGLPGVLWSLQMRRVEQAARNKEGAAEG